MNRTDEVRRLPALQRVVTLREVRVRAAETELAAAQAEVRRSEADLLKAEEIVSVVDRKIADLAAWFEAGPDARHLDAALARRGALVGERADALTAVGRRQDDACGGGSGARRLRPAPRESPQSAGSRRTPADWGATLGGDPRREPRRSRA